jgi:hypothetical protein
MQNSSDTQGGISLATQLRTIAEMQNTIQLELRAYLTPVLTGPGNFHGGNKEFSLGPLYEMTGIPKDFDKRRTPETEKYCQMLRDSMDAVLAEVWLETKWRYASITDNDSITFVLAERKVQVPESQYLRIYAKIKHSDAISTGV